MEKEEEYYQLCEAIDKMATAMKVRARIKHAEGKKGWKKTSLHLAKYEARKRLNEMKEGSKVGDVDVALWMVIHHENRTNNG